LIPRERMLRACRGASTDRPPVWLMRQAGRYLPEYRAIRERASFLEMCRDPDPPAEVSLQPYERFHPDAVIVFSDILLPLTGLGIELDFRPGPVVENPIEAPAHLERLEGSVAEAMSPTCEAIRRLRARVGESAAVIGFAGAPWTLAAYVSERTLSRDLAALGAMSYREPQLLDRLLDRMAEVTAETLRLQLEAGADLIQIFDTWAGMLAPERFRRLAGRALHRVFEALPAERPPVILFARGAAHLIEELAELGPDVVSLDWRIDLAEAVQRIGTKVSLQGNLDPAALFAPPPRVRREVAALIEAGRKARGHVLNLGHGVHRLTPVEGVAAFVDTARDAGGREA
jgi:uroporphyrinogen decarboxylase